MTLRQVIARIVVTASVASSPGGVARAAQDAAGVVGTWTLVSEVAHQGGTTSEPLGAHPVGSLMLDAGGRFMLLIARRDLPRFAANRREAGTAAENKAVLSGLLAFFGTFTVSGGMLTLHPEASTFPNWVGKDQQRSFVLEGDEMRWTNKAPAIAAQEVEVVWRRAR